MADWYWIAFVDRAKIVSHDCWTKMSEQDWGVRAARVKSNNTDGSPRSTGVCCETPNRPYVFYFSRVLCHATKPVDETSIDINHMISIILR